MPRALPDNDVETWSHTLCLLILGFICYALPWTVIAAPVEPVLRIQGSNTIGAKLGPALVKGMFEEQGLRDIGIQAGEADNEQLVSGRNAEGREVRVRIAAHGSGTGFSALKDGSTELAASSRPIKDGEVQALSSLGDFKSHAAEQIIALDGLAIILNPDNPLDSLTTTQLAGIFAGEIRNWEEIGGRGGAIRLYARDDNSGTYDTFKELVLAAHGKTLAGSAKRYESSEQLSDAVSQDAHGIGFIGLPYVRRAKAVSIADGDSQAMPPSTTLIATEDYPLSRRLFLYLPPTSQNAWARELVRFAQSPRGQAIVEQNGFIAQTVQAVKVTPNAAMPEDYRELASQALRLSVNFRFQEGSATLDNKAQRDLERVLGYLRGNGKMTGSVVLVGFGDPKLDPHRAALLSKLRAMTVRRELARQGVGFREIAGLGDQLPVAGNDGEDGRMKNRRVEVWVY
ncbi:substrate-binding domain-containing protein [Zestomonas carbonaria]|uniref:OmpA-like domain-containing protein n=1 Tax=Zestomonas carbonaria TaxID=2762745 RepID=A0A7U7ESU0_9GAMM|nr:substrate-binding domain-containing protein [Pseudomonas carbonaria]CAD5110534.1 hypothetical protein PSEWESI4_04857 [Pseudomonas carbonaria]